MWRSSSSVASVKEGICASRSWASPCFSAVRTSVISSLYSIDKQNKENITQRRRGRGVSRRSFWWDRHSCLSLFFRQRQAKTKRDRQECLSYSRGGEFLLEALGFIVLDEAVDEGGEFAVHDFGQLMEREADAVIGYAVLREIVGADFFGAVASFDLSTALGGEGGLALLLLLFV